MLATAMLTQGQIATHYGESYNGSPLGCSGHGYYSSYNDSIAAVGPANYAQYPCGTPIQVCGPNACHTVVRRDSCPGCAANMVDLSEAAIEIVCGGRFTCRVTFNKVIDE